MILTYIEIIIIKTLLNLSLLSYTTRQILYFKLIHTSILIIKIELQKAVRNETFGYFHLGISGLGFLRIKKFVQNKR